MRVRNVYQILLIAIEIFIESDEETPSDRSDRFFSQIKIFVARLPFLRKSQRPTSMQLQLQVQFFVPIVSPAHTIANHMSFRRFTAFLLLSL